MYTGLVHIGTSEIDFKFQFGLTERDYRDTRGFSIQICR